MKSFFMRLMPTKFLSFLFKETQYFLNISFRPTLSQGFTLIELSVVLVIIGLLTGSVLVGQDLIKAAAIRAQIAQIEKYNTSVHAFQNKYGGLPGDLAYTLATQFGFFTSGMNGLPGRGDGNGLIENAYGSQGFIYGLGYEYIDGEINAFWRHLSDAGMIDGTFGAGLIGTGGSCGHNGAGAGGCLPSNQNASQVNLWMPAAKIGKNASIVVYSLNGYNYYQIVVFADIGGAALSAFGPYNGTSPFTPIEAFAIDTKADDGLPNSGKILALEGNLVMYPLVTPSQAATHCLVFGTPATYDVGATYGNTLKCSLGLQFQ